MTNVQVNAVQPTVCESGEKTYGQLRPFSLRVAGDALELRYDGKSVIGSEAIFDLLAPAVDSVEGTMLDPALPRAIVRISPYPGMACGDRIVLRWDGLDVEGYVYQHEIVRFVSEGQVGKELVFAVKSMHIAALDGGSLEVYWTLTSNTQTLSSAALQLDVGDPALRLLAPHVEETVGEVLDPGRIARGICISLQPYARMAVGDRIQLSWDGGGAQSSFNDALIVESFAVGEPVSFWIAVEDLTYVLGDKVEVRYQVQQGCGVVRESEVTRVVFAELNRGVLDAPDVLEIQEGVLAVEESIDGVTVVIGNAQAQEGELVYLKCDGDFFNHRDDREITREMAGEPLVFIVPHRFWREHAGTQVRVAYSVERLNDVSQASAVTQVLVEG